VGKEIQIPVFTDKLTAYLDGIELAFGADTRHRRTRSIMVENGTQLIGRFHGTLKDCSKAMRSFASEGTAKIVMDGWLAHYNSFRAHHAPKGKTPAEVAGAESPYHNWRDMIEKD
jgi:hypothetical protein